MLVPGRNCWRIERAHRLAFLIDGAAYFAALWLLGFRLEDFSRRDRIAAPAPAADPDVDD